MTDTEFNENTAQLIKLFELEQHLRIFSNVQETMGEWDELLEAREENKRNYDYLFSDCLSNPALTKENKAKINELKRTLYPLLLCDLAKCYEGKERFEDEEAVLLEARSLGSKGAEVLLFSLYEDHMSEGKKVQNLFFQAFSRVKSIDFFSEAVTTEINNKRFQCSALVGLATAYLVFEENANKAHEYLARALENDWPDDLKENIRELLLHFKKTLFGGYRYVE